MGKSGWRIYLAAILIFAILLLLIPVYKYQDDSFPAVAGTRYSNRPNIKFGKIDSVPNPAVLVWPLNNGWAFTNDIAPAGKMVVIILPDMMSI